MAGPCPKSNSTAPRYVVVDLAGLLVICAVRDVFIDTTRQPTGSLGRVAGLVRADLLLEVEAAAWLP